MQTCTYQGELSDFERKRLELVQVFALTSLTKGVMETLDLNENLKRFPTIRWLSSYNIVHVWRHSRTFLSFPSAVTKYRAILSLCRNMKPVHPKLYYCFQRDSHSKCQFTKALRNSSKFRSENWHEILTVQPGVITRRKHLPSKIPPP